jgi:hypothetical protein
MIGHNARRTAMMGVVRLCSIALAMLSACTFHAGSTSTACDATRSDFPFRRRLTIDPAPAGYTIRAQLDAATSAALFARISNPDALRVMWHDEQIDRIVRAWSATTVEIMFRVQEPGGYPGGPGEYYLSYANSTTTPAHADPRAVFLWSERFDEKPPGSDGSPELIPLPAADWKVFDDGADRVYRVTGGNRHSARIASIGLDNGVFEARMKYVNTPALGDNGLAIRANSLDPINIDTYVVQLRAFDQTNTIVTYRGGAFTGGVTPQPFTITSGQWYRLHVAFFGATVEYEIDGVLVQTLTNAESSRPNLGLFGFSTDAEFDDVTLRPLIRPEPSATAGAEEMIPTGC